MAISANGDLNKVITEFSKVAADILNNADWFDAKPVTQADLEHYCSLLYSEAKAELSKGKDFTIASSRGIAVWGIRSAIFDEHYYKFLISVANSNPK